MEDAACALGYYSDGSAVGTLSDFGCWSFDARNLLWLGKVAPHILEIAK